jgi:hypothetical protein
VKVKFEYGSYISFISSRTKYKLTKYIVKEKEEIKSFSCDDENNMVRSM